jgi:fatty acid desaturase
VTPRRIPYAQLLGDALPSDAFAPNPARLGWLGLHLVIVASSMTAIGRGWGGIGVASLLGLLIGHSFACMGFVAHETLHGSVVGHGRARYLIGWLGFLPFMVAPHLWVVWHNRLHHGHTMEPEIDPDAYPSLAAYRRNRWLRLIDRLALGPGRPAGVVSLLLGFTGQSAQALFTVGGNRAHMSRRQQLLAIGETLAAGACWVAVGLALGPLKMLFAFVIPLVVGNAVVMAYILTNHSLSPYTEEVSDPLLSALSVTTPRIWQRLHLGFGYHVEHHMFPSMSPIHAPQIRQLVLERWPKRYQSMPLGRALRMLFRTARIHQSARTLVDPRTGRQWPTLLPRVGPTPATSPTTHPPTLRHENTRQRGSGPDGSAVSAQRVS